jgi:hypothetical protein
MRVDQRFFSLVGGSSTFGGGSSFGGVVTFGGVTFGGVIGIVTRVLTHFPPCST